MSHFSFFSAQKFGLLLFVSLLVSTSWAAQVPESLANAIASGKVVFKLTVPAELKEVLGHPEKEEISKDGESEFLQQSYSVENVSLQAVFVRMDAQQLFSLFAILCDDEMVDIGQNSIIELRTVDDLAMFDTFFGLDRVSLKNLDLTGQKEVLDRLPFSSETLWPPRERLPVGFSPEIYISQGQNPGLGVRSLHEAGIDGRGIKIAIIDQPLLPGHQEYAKNLLSNQEIDVEGVAPQMHGPAVVGIAVGKDSGVAPGAMVHFFATPTWKSDNLPIVKAIQRILQINEKLSLSERIRVVSISTGMFPQFAHYPEYEAVKKELEDSGVLLFTCLQESFFYSTLQRIPGADPEVPESYRVFYPCGPEALLVPAGGRLIADFHGENVWKYDPTGGLSWSTPYLAGLAAMAFQVDSQISPNEIKEFLIKSATQTKTGKIVNPKGFIALVKGRKTSR